VGVRVPYLIHHNALMIADDGVATLMGKHLAEGEPASVYYYGDVHEGTFSQHVYAVFIKLFGYSVIVVKLATLLFFLIFMSLHYQFLKKIFSPQLALMTSLFYCLPIGNIVLISFDTINSFPILLTFAILTIILTYLIFYEDRDNLVPALGFLGGLAFWDHQIFIYFLLTIGVLFALKFRFHIKKYLELACYFLLGCFPIVLYDITNNFSNIRWLLEDRKSMEAFPIRSERAVTLMNNLLSHETHFFNYLYLGFIGLGMAGIVWHSLKQKKFSPKNVYVVFFFISMLVYFFSRFSNTEWIRYMYPLYFAGPVLLLAVFHFIASKVKYILMTALVLGIFFISNLRGSYDNFLLVKQADGNLKQVVQAMERSGNRYWFGEYWSAFLLTALSRENVVVYPFDFPPYHPYRLAYYNRGQNSNFVFSGEIGTYVLRFKEYLDGIREWKAPDVLQANNLINLVKTLNTPAKIKHIGESILVYDVAGDIFVRTTFASAPSAIPEIVLQKIASSKGYLQITFKNNMPSDDYRFLIHVEIPDYSAVKRSFSSKRSEIDIRIPYPEREEFTIKYFVDYKGLIIPSTIRETSYAIPFGQQKEKRPRMVFLSGVGPFVTVHGEKKRILEKDAKLVINSPLNKDSEVHLDLHSPFQFSDPNWFGDYHQSVIIEINGVLCAEQSLGEGANEVILKLSNVPLKVDNNILSMRFRYHLPFAFAPFWKTSALLASVRIQ
jgi:hypothetical protein